MEEQKVRDAIRMQIQRKEDRIKELYAERKTVNKDEQPARYRFLTENIGRLDHSIMTLIELEHMLHLCDCPDNLYMAGAISINEPRTYMGMPPETRDE